MMDELTSKGHVLPSLVKHRLPLIVFYNTGWVQFGYRFSMDVPPLLFVLLAVGLRRITSLLKAAIAAAWLINLWGAVWWFARFY